MYWPVASGLPVAGYKGLTWRPGLSETREAEAVEGGGRGERWAAGRAEGWLQGELPNGWRVRQSYLMAGG